MWKEKGIQPSLEYKSSHTSSSSATLSAFDMTRCMMHCLVNYARVLLAEYTYGKCNYVHRMINLNAVAMNCCVWRYIGIEHVNECLHSEAPMLLTLYHLIEHIWDNNDRYKILNCFGAPLNIQQ